MTDNIIHFDAFRRPTATPAPEADPAPEAPVPAKSPTRSKTTPPRAATRRPPDDDAPASPTVEPNITRITGEGGHVMYRVQLRKKVNGRMRSFTRSFSKLALARKWKKKKLAEFELHGVAPVSACTVKEVIDVRLARHAHLQRSARSQLAWLRDSHFGARRISEIAAEDLMDLADEMLDLGRAPQTVAGYMTHLVRTLDWASRRGYEMPVSALRQAMSMMWEDGVLARAEARDCRPTLDELDRILSARAERPNARIPLCRIILFAIFSCRRLGEITRLRWDDLRMEEGRILVREMKHPRNKTKNNVWCRLTDEALAIIEAMPRTCEYIFPYDARSIGKAWRRTRDRAGVADLRFHDLRHEGVSRLFEMGEPAAFVAKYSGHENGGCLHRYEHVERHGDTFAGFPWTRHVTEVFV